MHYLTEKLSQIQKGTKILQLQISINDGKFKLSYNESLINVLGIKETDFGDMISNLAKIVDPKDSLLNKKELVSLYVTNTQLTKNSKKKDDYEVEQELRAISNSRDFSKEINKTVNYIVLKDIFLKMGVDQETIDAQLKSDAS